jgi:hypothetical protein
MDGSCGHIEEAVSDYRQGWSSGLELVDGCYCMICGASNLDSLLLHV